MLFNPLFEEWQNISRLEGELGFALTSIKRRRQLVTKYSWAIPDPIAIDLIVKYSPIVEIGAGTGYWANLIKVRGGEIICFDNAPPSPETRNHYGHRCQYFPVCNGGPEVLLRFHTQWTLFLCWPPYEEPMAFDALTKYKGNTVIYIGEGEYGCTADDAFHKKLYDEWQLVHTHQLRQWDGIHDSLEVRTRRKGYNGRTNHRRSANR